MVATGRTTEHGKATDLLFISTSGADEHLASEGEGDHSGASRVLRGRHFPELVAGSIAAFGASFVRASYQYLDGLYSQRLTGGFFSTN